MSGITCLACNVGFDDADLGRIHYKTDWHRYNLKRKVASLAPVTLERFEERQKAQEQQDAPSTPESCYCKPCKLSFSSSNAYENHLQSKKHIASTKSKKGKKKKKKTCLKNTTIPQVIGQKMERKEEEMSEDEDDSDVESWDSYDENVIGMEECLFCSFISLSMEDNLTHMTSEHGFFLPDADYICDLEGLIAYLGEKVGAGHVCLWCNEKGKRFHGLKNVQRHMLDKGHCKILHIGETIFEFADFYDYSKSYPAGENGNQDESMDTESTDIAELDGDGYSLTLPSGAVIGHRSLLRYYRQNLVPQMRERTRKVLPKMLAQYKALGWTGATGLLVEQRAKDLNYMQRVRNRHYMKLGMKANNLRHHFRDSNPI